MDTCGLLLAPAIKEACEAMIAQGLDAPLADAIAQYDHQFRGFPRDDVYDRLVAFFGCNDADQNEVAAAGRRAFFHREVESHITPFDGVYELLTQWQQEYQMYLVTSGSPKTQQAKIDILDLEPYFKAVYLVDRAQGDRKQKRFAEIQALEQVPTQQMLCIGDRIDREIRAANGLGMKTCHKKGGEWGHLVPSDPLEHADYEIDHISQLVSVLDH